MKKYLSTIILVTLVIVGGVYYFTRADTSTWKTYVNTAYDYQVSYPASMVPDYIGNFTVPVEKSKNIFIGVQNDGPMKFTVTEYATSTDLGALSLKQFSEKVRQDQVDYKNPYTPNKQTGEIKQITFAGKTAYSFTQTLALNKPFGDDSFAQQSLPDNEVLNLVFIENNSNQKFMISYPVGDPVAEQMKNSFKLTTTANK